MGSIWLATVEVQEKVKVSSQYPKAASIYAINLIYPNQKSKGKDMSSGEHRAFTDAQWKHGVQVKNGRAKDSMDFWHVNFFFQL